MIVRSVSLLSCLLSLSSSTPYYDFLFRLEEFKAKALEGDGCDWWRDVLKLHFRHETFCEAGLVDKIHELDDFEMAGLSWIVTHEWNNPLLSETVKNAFLARLVSVPWWLDQAGSFLQNNGSGHLEYWSENHQVGWISGQYLIGAAMAGNPDLADIVLGGINDTASLQYKLGQERLLRWLDFRGRFGFSEYNSDTYAPIAFDALVTVAGSAPDKDIKTLATIITYLQMFDWIIGSHKGIIGTPRGRAYQDGKLLERGASSQSIHSILWLLTGEGDHDRVNYGRKDVIMMILAMEAGLEIPPVLFEVAEALKSDGSLELRERFAISSSPEEAEAENIGFTSPEDCIFWLGNGGYFSPSTARCMFLLGDSYHLWDRHPIWEQLRPARIIWQTDPFIVDEVARLVRDIGGGPVLGRSNVYTWRTKEYMLSSVQDYHGGMTAGQQQSWQLSLDPGRGRTVFTTQPTDHSYKHDQYWVGGVLPRLGQARNTLIAIYNPALLVEIVFNTTITHAHFYREGYEELVEGGGWVMARQGDTFVALYSQQAMTWTDNTEYLDRELVAQGSQNVWICHVGDSASYSDFSNFTQTVLQSRVEVEGQAEDSLVQCLRSEKCLAGNVLRTVECLSSGGDCSLERYPHSSLGQCLVKQGSHGEFHHLVSSLDPASQRLTDVRKLSRYLDCLRTSQSEISVRFSISDSRLSLDWSGELTYQGPGDAESSVVSRDEFRRYENLFSSTEWGSKNIRIQAANTSIDLDLENITINQTY